MENKEIAITYVNPTADFKGSLILSMNSNIIHESLEDKLFVILFGWEVVVAVAIYIAQGALQYIGGRAMAQILGHPELNDVDSLIRRAIDELKNYIREELRRQIEENEIRKMVASLKSVVNI